MKTTVLVVLLRLLLKELKIIVIPPLVVMNIMYVLQVFVKIKPPIIPVI